LAKYRVAMEGLNNLLPQSDPALLLLADQ